MRMNTGTLATPMATMAVVVDAPNAAANITAASTAGKANDTSASRPTISSIQPRRMPATAPSGMPTRPEMATARMPTYNVRRAPCMIWENTSRPNLSVPIGCFQLMARRRSGALMRVGG
jgi:hypothetical protein